MSKHQTMKKIAAAAALSVLVAAGTAVPAYAQGGEAAPKKTYQQGEYELFNACATDVGKKDFNKALTDCEAWKQKVPNSDYKDDRSVLLISTYNALKQYDKVLAEAGPMLDRDLDALFPDPKTGPGSVLGVLLPATDAITALPNATPEQTEISRKAATKLKDYTRKPEGLDQAQWDTALQQLKAHAKGALMTIEVRPGMAALNAQPQPDCNTAESALSKALSDFPDNAYIAYNLGQAYRCQARAEKSRYDELYPKAVYEYIRAMVLDPSLGGTQDAKKMTELLTNLYVGYHGGSDGLDQLKEQAKANPMPPAGFTIESATAAAARKQKEFQEKYPQLAIWLGIKGQLSGANGEQYFKESLKDAAVPKLKGMLVEGKPACRSKELLVSIPEPEQQGAAPVVITLKLDAPLSGKPEAGEIQWEGVPSAFTSEPFMLTMDTEKAKVENLKTTPCAPAAHPGAKKGVAKKK